MNTTIVFEFTDTSIVRHYQKGLYEAYRAYELLLAQGKKIMLQHEGEAVRASWAH